MQVFEPHNFLELARKLSADSDNPAALRSAVSRAYNAAFLAARPVAIEVGVEFRLR